MKRKIIHAFTLIELLVVIAIIAILAAILFPVFAQAKNAAKTTVALAHVKQIGLAQQMYLDSYDDTFFLIRPEGSNPTYSTNQRLAKTWKHVLIPYTKNSDMFQDPTNAAGKIPDQASDVRVIPLSAQITPKFNRGFSYFRAFQKTGTLTQDGAPYVSSSISQPASAIILLETKDTYPDYGPWIKYALPNKWTDSAAGGRAPFSNWGGSKYLRPARTLAVNSDYAGLFVFGDSHAKKIDFPETCKVNGEENMWQYNPAQPKWSLDGKETDISWMNDFCTSFAAQM
jgi:prepilin-type N-terminal cleavage/methylation domain-containing protein